MQNISFIVFNQTTVQAVVFFCGILWNKINFGGGAVFV